MMYAGLGETGTGLGNEANADDFFLAIKDGLLGPVGWVLVVAVMISAISSTQTTILPTARGTLAMAAYKALPKRFATVHPTYKTPSFSTLVMGIVASLYYVGMTLISDNILQDSILSLGLAIAFYYGITGYACVWYFRRELFSSTRNFFYKGLLPLLGALMLTYAFVQSAIDMYDVDYGYTVLLGIGGTFVLGIGALAFGVRADVHLVLLPARQALLPRREPESRDAGAGARRSDDVRPFGRRRRLSPRPSTPASGRGRPPARPRCDAVRGRDAGVDDRAAERCSARPRGRHPSAARPSSRAARSAGCRAASRWSARRSRCSGPRRACSRRSRRRCRAPGRSGRRASSGACPRSTRPGRPRCPPARTRAACGRPCRS